MQKKQLIQWMTIFCFVTFSGLSAEDIGSDIDIDKLSEAFGHFIGRNLNPPGLQFNVDLVIKGIRDGAANKPAPMEDSEYEDGMAKLQILAFTKISDKNLSDAEEFLKENALKEGTVEIEPGKLQYKVLADGDGALVEEHFSPSINYKATYLDGTVFASSEEADGPTEMSLDQTLPGLSKGLVGMKVGEKRIIYIHPDLGFGTSGAMSPNALLIFEVEIVKANVEKPQEEESMDKEMDLSSAEHYEEESE